MDNQYAFISTGICYYCFRVNYLQAHSSKWGCKTAHIAGYMVLLGDIEAFSYHTGIIMTFVFQTTFFNYTLRNVVGGCTQNASLRFLGLWSTHQAAEVWGVSPRYMIDRTSRSQGHWYISTSPSSISMTVLIYQFGRVFMIRFGFFFVRHSCDFLTKIVNLHFQCR